MCMCVIYWEVEKCLISVACKCLFTFIYRFKEDNKMNQLVSFINSLFFVELHLTILEIDRTIPSTSFFTLIVLYSVCNCFISVCINVN